MAQQQKILLYVMPIFLAVISFQFPLGVLLYWVTTNLWQIVQQAIILREGAKIDAAAEKRRGNGANGSDTPPSGPARGATSGKKRTWDETRDRSSERAADEDAADESAADEGAAVENSSNGVGGDEVAPIPSPKPSERPSGGRRRLPRRGGA
jgi:YidC/Oxa1 family membrane protein insertase